MSANERFVVLGVAPVRREWFRQVGRWANEATIPVEFIKCISMTEVNSRLESGRPFSALLADASSVGLDRDVLDLANTVGCSPVIVDHGLVDREWKELGARAVIPERFEARDLTALLEEVAQPIGRTVAASENRAPTEPTPSTRGRVVAVTGAGGMGTSTIVMALAQGMASLGGHQPILLADMALRSSQAMFHDARDVVPGLTELVDGHRLGVPNIADAASTIHSFPERGYDLLLGLRHERDWVSITPRALSATWETLISRYSTTICDITGEFDGAEETGSSDIEDRNRLARMATSHADVIAVVGAPGAWGIHHLVRTILALSELGVSAQRLVPIINHAPRNARSRSELTSAVGELLSSRVSQPELVPTPIFLPTRRNLEATLRDGDPLPTSLVTPLAATVAALMPRHDPIETPHQTNADAYAGVPVAPGSLGTWSADDE